MRARTTLHEAANIGRTLSCQSAKCNKTGLAAQASCCVAASSPSRLQTPGRCYRIAGSASAGHKNQQQQPSSRSPTPSAWRPRPPTQRAIRLLPPRTETGIAALFVGRPAAIEGVSGSASSRQQHTSRHSSLGTGRLISLSLLQLTLAIHIWVRVNVACRDVQDRFPDSEPRFPSALGEPRCPPRWARRWTWAAAHPPPKMIAAAQVSEVRLAGQAAYGGGVRTHP